MSYSRAQREQKDTTTSKYDWNNRSEYSRDEIPQLGNKLTKCTSREQIQSHVLDLFRKILSKSRASMLYLNEQTNQMSLYTLPLKSNTIIIYPDQLNYQGSMSDSKQYFTYGWGLFKYNGGRGFGLNLSASKSIGSYVAEAGYFKIIGQRLDNNFKSNTDKNYISLTASSSSSKYFDNLSFYINRQSRSNYIDPVDINSMKERIFGFTPSDKNLLKHSNLWSVFALWQKEGRWAGSKIAWDYGNKSYFIFLSFYLHKKVEISQSIETVFSLQGAQIWGQNILKNDLIFRNKCCWTGNRGKNYLSPRVELYLTKYPYLTVLGLNPYFYVQAWTSFNRHENGQINTHIESDYGLGFMTTNFNVKLDISLLKMSADKNGWAFGSFKFGF